MKIYHLFQQQSVQALTPIVVLLLTLIAGYIAKRLLFAALTRFSQKTTSKIDDIIVHAAKGPFMIWVLMLAIHLAAQVSPLSDRISNLVGKALLFLLVLSLTVVGSKVAGEAVRAYGSRAQSALPVTSLTQNLAQVLVIVIGLLILLNSLGLSIAPLLTALGVGGLAVALGLQDTLANFFAGFYVSLAGYVRLDDYIKLNSGEEGYVTDIRWRTTTIRSLSNNLIIIPNSKLAQAVVTNYYLPDKRISLTIAVSVSYASDPCEIERILVEEAKKGVGQIQGLLGEPSPVARFTSFGSYSMDFSLVCHVSEFADQPFVQHEMRKRILARFRNEKIEMPFPSRTIFLRGEQNKP
jgi:small-conductance mechanosensitive channel